MFKKNGEMQDEVTLSAQREHNSTINSVVSICTKSEP
jgi:hypothetical protein